MTKGKLKLIRIFNGTFREVHFRWIGIFMLATVMTLLYREPHETFLEKYPTAFLFTAIFWNGAFMIFMHFRKRFPQIRQTPKRLVFTLIALSAFLILGDPALCLMFNFKSWQEVLDPTKAFEHSVTNFYCCLCNRFCL